MRGSDKDDLAHVPCEVRARGHKKEGDSNYPRMISNSFNSNYFKLSESGIRYNSDKYTFNFDNLQSPSFKECFKGFDSILKLS